MPVDLGPDNWIWGPDDQLGAGNRMTTRTILGALQKVQKGEIIDLSHDVAQGAPSIPPIQSPYVMTVSSSAQNSAPPMYTGRRPMRSDRIENAGMVNKDSP